ncbi:MAG: polyprenyl synthetase family protein [Desulfobacterales bacterium]|nr:MAG: polyprenyl synthetase family protein [Desulfobacterales bacterium]
MFDLQVYIQQKNRQINDALEKIFKIFEPDETLIKAMKYSLMAGGKRIRPVLCLGATEALGGRSEDALTAACAIEMIHTYSLIHDDLPAMDDDGLRRGKPTCHIAFNEATAILAGDALLTLAFEILSSTSPEDAEMSAKCLKIIRIISTAAGCQGMIQGQMLDIASEGCQLSASELESMHSLKTGALIEASLHCGAVIADAGEHQKEMLKAYGRNIGLAFQVTDDILNVEGNPELMGKAIGTDQQHDKSTYPSLLGVDASKKFAQKLIIDALKALENFDKKAEPLRALATYIIARKR